MKQISQTQKLLYMTVEPKENLFYNNFIYVGKTSILHLCLKTKGLKTKNSKKETLFFFKCESNVKKHILKNIVHIYSWHCVKLYLMISKLKIWLVFLLILTWMCNIVTNALMLQLRRIFYVKNVVKWMYSSVTKM